jgi:hypothetical protein
MALVYMQCTTFLSGRVCCCAVGCLVLSELEQYLLHLSSGVEFRIRPPAMSPMQALEKNQNPHAPVSGYSSRSHGECQSCSEHLHCCLPKCTLAPERSVCTEFDSLGWQKEHLGRDKRLKCVVELEAEFLNVD